MRTVIRFILYFLVFVLYSQKIYSVSAYPFKIIVTTSTGKSAEIYLRGDEHQKYALSADGYTLLNDSMGWWYATVSEDGHVKKSSFMLMSHEEETAELKKYKMYCPKGIIPPKVVTQRVESQDGTQTRTSGAPCKGERRALVILMQYKDLPFKKTKEEFEKLFNTIGYNDGGAVGSVRDYYKYVSQEQLDYVSDIYGPYTTNNQMYYYGSNDRNNNDANPLELCIEAIKSLPNDFDYKKYDNDGDGLVDNVHIIFAGYGEEAGAPSYAIWSHEYPHRINMIRDVGFSLASYSCSPELRGNFGSNISHIGVVCHELGHTLGAMDYYDTNYGTGGEYTGTGMWDIMASGSWNDDGRSPANFNPYVRSTVFGWNQQVTLESDQNISMPQIDNDNATQTVVYRINTGSDGDYFLLENRQQYKFDSAIPGAGLLIYHVHPYIDRLKTTNSVNTTHPQGLYPVCASNSEPNEKKYGNINSSGCPFPGSSNNKTFSPTSSPAAVAWNGSKAKVSISDIRMNLTDGTVTFSTGGESNPDQDPDVPDTPTEKNVVYKESFEGNISGRININAIYGNEVWRTYKKGDFVMNAENIPAPTDGVKILMMYSSKGTAVSESEAVGPEIDVVAGTNYVISFDIKIDDLSTAYRPDFKMYVEDENGEYNIYTLDEITKDWRNVEIPLVFANEKIRCKLQGKIYSSGIFVDNLRLYKEEDLSQVETRRPLDFAEIDKYKVFTLSGVFVTEISLRDIKNLNLPKGIYILRQNDKTSKISLE